MLQKLILPPPLPFPSCASSFFLPSAGMVGARGGVDSYSQQVVVASTRLIADVRLLTPLPHLLFLFVLCLRLSILIPSAAVEMGVTSE